MEEIFDVAIVGAGASGLVCAWQSAKKGKKVLILEKNDVAGKKILASGNGRCNFTNQFMEPSCYHGDTAFISDILRQFPTEKAIQLFHEIGIYEKERDGYFYPYAGQAVTVRDFLIAACKREGVQFWLDTKVAKAVHKDGVFRISAKGGKKGVASALVLACGGKANQPLGGDGSGYLLARSFGHQVTKLFPALTGLCAAGKEWEQLAGVRMQGQVSLFADGKTLAKEQGEIQIVKDGLSGIPVFQLCAPAAKALEEGKEVVCEIDFLPDWDSHKIQQWEQEFGEAYLQGLVPKKWVPVLRERAKKETLSVSLKHYPVKIVEPFGMERAQVTSGGVPTHEIDSQTMESKKVNNLYLIGELLDVDGICGGYNLHFAWATGYLCACGISGSQEE